MNEQQVADLFSQQLDHLLQGQTPVLPPEASDLQELLDFGQQFSQITFQPSPTAQAAFQGQLASWFGPTPGGLASVLGISKTLLFTIIAAAILVGTGAGLAVLGVPSLGGSNGLSAPETPVLPTAAPKETPQPPNVNTETQDSSEPEAPATPAATPRTPQSSLGETIPAGGTSSLGDTIPSSPSMGDTMSLPTPTPTATAEGADVGTGEGIIDDTNGDDTSGGGVQGKDDDKGHGNDPDGIDEDNPGNSGDILGGDGNGQGQGGGLDGLGRGNEGGGGGQGDGNNQGGGNNKGGGKDKDKNK